MYVPWHDLKAQWLKAIYQKKTLGFVIEQLHEFEHVTRRIWDVEEEEGVFKQILESASTKVVLNLIMC